MEPSEEKSSKTSLTIRRRLWGQKGNKFVPPFKAKIAEGISDVDQRQKLDKVLESVDKRIAEVGENGGLFPDIFKTPEDEENNEPHPGNKYNLAAPKNVLASSAPVTSASTFSNPKWNRVLGGAALHRSAIINSTTSGNMKQKSNSPTLIAGSAVDDGKKYYAAMYAKPSNRKHKVWEGDGFIVVSGSSVVLKDTDGKIMERNSKFKLTEEMISDCKAFKIGGKECEILELLTKNPFDDSGKPIEEEVLLTYQNTISRDEHAAPAIVKPFVCPVTDKSNIVKQEKDLSLPMFDPNEEGADNSPSGSKEIGEDDLGSAVLDLEESSSDQDFVDEPPKKKQNTQQKAKSSSSANEKQKSNSPTLVAGNAVDDEKKYYAAMYAKPSNKKHKVWEGDGFIVVSGSSVVLKNTNGKVMERSSKFKLTEEMISDCKAFKIGGKECEILELLTKNPFDDSGNPIEEEVLLPYQNTISRNEHAAIVKQFVCPVVDMNIVKQEKDLSLPVFDKCFSAPAFKRRKGESSRRPSDT